MEVVALLFSVSYAIIMMLLLVTLFSNIKVTKRYWPFFFLIILITLGSGLGNLSIGPSIRGFYWFPGLIASILVAVIMVAFSRRTNDVPEKEESKKEEISNTASTESFYATPSRREVQKKIYQGDESIGSVVVSGFFWIIILLLSIILIVGILIDKQFLK
jgi:hypothetical protein